MMSSRSRAWIRRTALAGAILLLLLWILNLPFYAGAGGPRWRWRMEHGRLRIEHRSEPIDRETFYVDLNSEGLRFGPEWEFRRGDWSLNVPLWIPLALCVAVFLALRPARESPPL